ncbi:TetR/AcrR family transcriptional regulator [Crenobacter caeni]|uniref:TetR/AcrR family transcriptional regulator n=1 Tax=Crenobacter caeni TaxID=2705474 RepID=A0A6B2KQE9_9NEIS|nr:TetR/AcrR family transcriptional regulator [Crenobacter caeni]NDV12455.1 TetR/AcrR family transcriptional regulator [Crenobacter caeni]
MKCDPSARGDTRRKILDLAEGLFLSRGFSALSYQQVSKVLGVRNAAIHYHFPHKTDLGVALIQRYRRRFERFVDSQAELGALEQLVNYFELSTVYFSRDRQICPSGVLSTEYPALPDEMQREALGFIGQMRAWAVAIADKGRAEGCMRYPGEPEAMGLLMFSALQGALQLARIEPDMLVAVKAQICRLLDLPPDALAAGGTTP